MREIKFRAWDGIRITTSGIQFCASDGKLTMIQGMPLMQFTGLKDKNGKDIYEGDIISIPNPWSSGAFNAVIENDGCNFNISKSKNPIFDMNKNIEVIGNIYENPELLNKE